MSETTGLILVLAVLVLASWKLLDLIRGFFRGVDKGARGIGRGVSAVGRGLQRGVSVFGTWCRAVARSIARGRELRTTGHVRLQSEVIALQAHQINELRCKLDEFAELRPKDPRSTVIVAGEITTN